MFKFVKKKEPSTQTDNSESLIKELEEIYKTNENFDGVIFESTYLKETTEVERMINKILKLKNLQIRELFMRNLDLLENVTQMDYVKDMVDSISLQKESVSEIASGSEEMSSSIEEISNHVQTTLSTTREAVCTSSDSIKMINESFKYINQSFEEINIVQGKMHDVAEGTKEIDSVVNIINNVAEQTNLLALNASIEAARSGEAGKGFSVVASEIKKLADNTKQSVGYIKDMVENLRSEIDYSEAAMNKAIDVFSKGREFINDSTQSMNKMEGSLNSVCSIFEGISANVEEQSATTQEITAKINEINNQTQKLSDVCMRTGQGIYDISAHIEKTKAISVPYFKDLEESHLKRVSATEHLLWKWKAYNAVCGFVKLDDRKIPEHTDCNVGRFLNEKKQKQPTHPWVVNLEEPHKQIHRLTKEIIHEVNNGNRNKLDALLLELDEATEVFESGAKRLPM